MQVNSEIIVHRIIRRVKELTDSGFLIRFLWIPAHCRIEGNLVDDSLTKQAGVLGIGGINSSLITDLNAMVA